ncbi:unnamed protein product, partial [Meganyctiphanes norvegica]
CKPKKLCRKNDGKCISKLRVCKGPVIDKGCKSKKCQCCVEESSRFENKHNSNGRKYKIDQDVESGSGEKLKSGKNKNEENKKKGNERKLKTNESKPVGNKNNLVVKIPKRMNKKINGNKFNGKDMTKAKKINGGINKIKDRKPNRGTSGKKAVILKEKNKKRNRKNGIKIDGDMNKHKAFKPKQGYG